MVKKLTYEFIKDKFEEKGYTLLSNDYINSKVKLDYICPEGHEGSIRWNDFNTGYGCIYCAGKAKLTYEFVKSEFEKEGYTLLSELYINARTKLDYICPVGHRHSVTWSSWSYGCRCLYCDKQVKPSFGKVRKSFLSEGYILLSNEYVNVNTKLRYICPNGHKHSIRWRDWNTLGNRCPHCAGNAKLTIEFVRNSFEEEGYKLLSTEYVNSTTKLIYECPLGHTHSMTWANWYTGVRCPTCYRLSAFGSGNPSWRGGKSFEEYCEIWKDKDFKLDLRQRDKNRCLNPYCSSRSPKDLTIHHIDYNKKNCHPKNLITVCRSCNARANFERKWHKAWYQAVLNKRYNYKY